MSWSFGLCSAVERTLSRPASDRYTPLRLSRINAVLPRFGSANRPLLFSAMPCEACHALRLSARPRSSGRGERWREGSLGANFLRNRPAVERAIETSKT